MKNRYLFTSESVSEGHPDKVADFISDSILDACLEADPQCRTACETFTTTDFVLTGGEISLSPEKFEALPVEKIVREAVASIGYNKEEYKFNAATFQWENRIHSQSPDIAQGVTGTGLFKAQGAGDQGMMFGFACNETPELMPAPLQFSHTILKRASALRKEGSIRWLRPDSKSQVSILYENHKPIAVDTVIVSHQHDEDVSYAEIERTIINEIIKPVLEPTGLLTKETKYLINPTGKFVIGGPHGDSGLTGRKLIVDTYGGMGRHGGGSFSGKDPSKVDRSAAYMARYIAKNIVASGVCERCELQLAYAIGYPQPVSVMVDTFGTSATDETKLTALVQEMFDLSPAGIIKALDLRRPIYKQTTFYGHFGKPGLPWEKTDKADEIARALS